MPEIDATAAQKAVDLIDRLMRARRVSPGAQAHYPIALLACAQSDEFSSLDEAADAAVAVAEHMAAGDSEPEQFAFDESKHPRREDGKFGPGGGGTGGDDSDAETPDFTTPGATAPRGGVRGKIDSAVAAVKEKGVGGASLAALKGTIAGVGKIADGMAGPLVKAGYKPRTAKAIAITAAVLAGTPLSFGLLGAALGVLPAAAAAIPGAVEAGAVLGAAMGLKDPLGTARKALAAVRAIPGKLKARGEKKRATREAVASLKAEHEADAGKRRVAAASDMPRAQYAKRNIVWRDAYPDPLDNGMWRVPGVPVFAVVTPGDKSDTLIGRGELEGMVAHANRRCEVGHFRALHHGHQKNNPDGTPDLNGDQPLLAFCENWRVVDTTWGPVIHCDLWGIDDYTLSQFERGRFSFLSVEAGEHEIVSIAAMQSRPPYFEFPNLFVRRAKPAAKQHAATFTATQMASRRQYAASYPVRRMANENRGKDGKFESGGGGGGDVETPELTRPGKSTPERNKKAAKLRQERERDRRHDDNQAQGWRSEYAEEDQNDQYGDDTMPPMPFADDQEDGEDADQYADDSGAAPAGAPKPAAAEPEPAWVAKLMAAIQAIGKPAAPAAPVAPPVAPPVQHAAAPNTLRPLEPASSAHYALAPEDREAINAVKQYAAQIKQHAAKKAMLAEVRDSASRDELAVLEAQFDESPKAAAQFAALIRTRGRVVAGPATVVTVSAPKSLVTEAIKQFAASSGKPLNPADPSLRALAESARQDWQDTINDDGPDGKAMRLQFAGEAGCKRWIEVQLDKAIRRKRLTATT